VCVSKKILLNTDLKREFYLEIKIIM